MNKEEIIKSEEQKPFPKKFLKILKESTENYMENANSASTEDIKRMILSSEQNIYDIEFEISNNEELLKIKEQYKNEMEPFKDSKNLETAKLKYCLFVLEGRGVKI